MYRIFIRTSLMLLLSGVTLMNAGSMTTPCTGNKACEIDFTRSDDWSKPADAPEANLFSPRYSAVLTNNSAVETPALGLNDKTVSAALAGGVGLVAVNLN